MAMATSRAIEPGSAPDPEDDLTIEQLAAATGVAFTTIRLYQHKACSGTGATGTGRLLRAGPPARLELIASLQDRGYSLAAIKELVDTWQDGGR